MVFTGTGRIHIQGDKPCGHHKPYSDKKHPPKAWDKVQAIKDYTGKQPGPRIPFEKKRIEDLRYRNLSTDSVLLYEDEKGPIVAKTYGGTSWSSTQSKVSKAQKTKGILNVFGVYDYTNNQMWTHGYKKKTGKQFLDFIKRVDQKYDDSIRQIFLVLDNVSIHKSNKVKANDSQIPSKDTVSISSNKVTRTQPDRGKMAMDA